MLIKKIMKDLMTELMKHFFPERFSIATVTMQDMSELFTKAYHDKMNFTGETMQFRNPGVHDEA